MMALCAELDNDITYNSEQKMKLLYSYCSGYSHTISISNVIQKCLSPVILINNVTKGNQRILKHIIDNNNWIICADRDYEVGEEIIDSYGNLYDIKHPNYPSIKESR